MAVFTNFSEPFSQLASNKWRGCRRRTRSKAATSMVVIYITDFIELFSQDTKLWDCEEFVVQMLDNMQTHPIQGIHYSQTMSAYMFATTRLGVLLYLLVLAKLLLQSQHLWTGLRSTSLCCVWAAVMCILRVLFKPNVLLHTGQSYFAALLISFKCLVKYRSNLKGLEHFEQTNVDEDAVLLFCYLVVSLTSLFHLVQTAGLKLGHCYCRNSANRLLTYHQHRFPNRKKPFFSVTVTLVNL